MVCGINMWVRSLLKLKSRWLVADLHDWLLYMGVVTSTFRMVYQSGHVSKLGAHG